MALVVLKVRTKNTNIIATSITVSFAVQLLTVLDVLIAQPKNISMAIVEINVFGVAQKA
jgi:hypothetical protein